ncbi:MAG: hypothetical protein NVS3B20_26140 [Polyangiales bacterium]
MQGQMGTQQSGSVDIGEMQAKAVEGFKEARGTIEEFAKANPRTAVGAALGLGFILGGGLTPRILFGLGAVFARNFAKDFAKSQLSSVTRSFLGGGDDEPLPAKKATPSRARSGQD